MSKIITITFNPAIDKSTVVDKLIAGKKLRCTDPVYEPGGGGVNVARAIKKLGGNATAYYLAGGDTGKHFNELVGYEGISYKWTEIKDATRENFMVFEISSGNQYRFIMPGPEITPKESGFFLSGIEKAGEAEFIVVSGSLSGINGKEVFSRLRNLSEHINAKLIVDTSGSALKQAVNEGVYLIKPNIGELAKLAGVDYLKIEDVDSAGKEIIKNGRCNYIVVSLGKDGAMLISKDSFLKFRLPPVEVKSTVGAGDSMMAGIVLELSQDKSIEEAVRYGVACGTAATLNPGTELCKKTDADHFNDLVEISN